MILLNSCKIFIQDRLIGIIELIDFHYDDDCRLFWYFNCNGLTMTCQSCITLVFSLLMIELMIKTLNEVLAKGWYRFRRSVKEWYKWAYPLTRLENIKDNMTDFASGRARVRYNFAYLMEHHGFRQPSKKENMRQLQAIFHLPCLFGECKIARYIEGHGKQN